MLESVAKADILIVEDHPTMREAMRMVLEHEGFDIREASDGQAALAMARDRPPVIIVTAVGEEGREYILSLGADEYFTKPFSPLALLRTVEKVLTPTEGSG